MNEDLETYLMQVARQLRRLPPQQRESELREIENHLRTMIEAREVDGVPYSEAVSESLHQFGSARSVGRKLTRVWREQQKESPLYSLAAALVALVCQLGATAMMLFTCVVILNNAFKSGGNTSTFLAYFNWLSVGVIYGIAPSIGGYWADRIAPLRGWWMASVTYALVLGLYAAVLAPNYQSAGLFMITMLETLPALFTGAWLSKRWRARTQEKNLVFA